MSRFGESKVEWGPLCSPKSSQAQTTGKTKKQQEQKPHKNQKPTKQQKQQKGPWHVNSKGVGR